MDTIDAFLLSLDRLNYSLRTQQEYRQVLDQVAAGLGTRTPSSWSTKGLRQWIQSLPSAKRQGYVVIVLGQFGKFAGQSWDLVAPRVPARLPQFLTLERVTEILNEPMAPLTRALIEVLYGSALRVSEAARLRWGDVEWPEEGEGTTTGMLFVHQGKGQRDRKVPIGRFALAALKALGPRGRTDLVFAHANGDPYTIQSLELWLRPWGIRPHQLRHAVATHMLERGAGIEYLREFLGHSNIRTTQVYTRVAMTYMQSSYRLSHPRAHREVTGA